jgi:hypothetical protein
MWLDSGLAHSARPGMTLQVDHVHDFGSTSAFHVSTKRFSARHCRATGSGLGRPGRKLDPAIHPFAKKMDARIKSAHDEY